MGDDEGGPKLIDDGGGLTLATEITLDINEGTTTLSEGETTTYTSGASDKVKVKYQSSDYKTTGFQFYIHTLVAGGKFTLKKDIKYNASGGTAPLQGEDNPIPNVYEVYYYKHNTQDKGALKIKTSSEAKIFYSTTINTNSPWKNEEKESVPSTETELKALVEKIKDEVEIKIDKIKPYGCNKRINVEKTPGNGTTVPQGYVRYEHKPKNIATTDSFKLGLVRYKDIPLKFEPAPPTTGVTAVYVYYSDSDNTHEFPLIVCVKVSQTSRTYYKRGNTWTNIGGQLAGKDPESDEVSSLLNTEFNKIIDKYEIKLEQIGNYKATPQGDIITPEAVEEKGASPTYKGFKHEVPSGSVINRVTIHNQVITQISAADLREKQQVFVYFTESEANGNREKPLLICLSKDGISDNKTVPGNNIWYKRKESNGNFIWENVPNEYDRIKPGGTNGNTIETNLKNQLSTINGAVSGDPGYPKLEPNLSDTMKSNPDIGIMDFFNL